MNIEMKKVDVRQLRLRRPKSRSRRSMGGPIQQYIIQLVEENPEASYAEIASMVKTKYDHARTSERSVASTIYRAGV